MKKQLSNRKPLLNNIKLPLNVEVISAWSRCVYLYAGKGYPDYFCWLYWRSFLCFSFPVLSWSLGSSWMVNILYKLQEFKKWVFFVNQKRLSYTILGKVSVIQTVCCSILGKDVLKTRHVLSIVFVWAPVSGSTKFTEWFTVRWKKLSLFRELYAFQQSDITVVPGKIFSLIIDTRVLAVRSATHLKKTSLVF